MTTYYLFHSLTGSLARLVMAPWDSTPRSVLVAIVAAWRPFPAMTPRNQFILQLSWATKLAWPTSYVKLTNLARVSSIRLVPKTCLLYLTVYFLQRLTRRKLLKLLPSWRLHQWSLLESLVMLRHPRVSEPWGQFGPNTSVRTAVVDSTRIGTHFFPISNVWSNDVSIWLLSYKAWRQTLLELGRSDDCIVDLISKITQLSLKLLWSRLHELWIQLGLLPPLSF